MRRKDPEYLRSLLWTRINQQKMLNNTLCEMMTRNSNKKSVDMIKQLKRTVLVGHSERWLKAVQEINPNIQIIYTGRGY